MKIRKRIKYIPSYTDFYLSVSELRQEINKLKKEITELNDRLKKKDKVINYYSFLLKKYKQ